jgi:hypothetical protein
MAVNLSVASITRKHLFDVLKSCDEKRGGMRVMYQSCAGVNRSRRSSPARHISTRQSAPPAHVTAVAPHRPTDRHVTYRAYQVLSPVHCMMCIQGIMCCYNILFGVGEKIKMKREKLFTDKCKGFPSRRPWSFICHDEHMTRSAEL